MRRSISLVLALLLLVSLFAVPSVAQEVEQSYVVSFTGGAIPANAASLVSQAGGRITMSLPQIGVVQAASSNPEFANLLAQSQQVWAAGPDAELSLEPLEEIEEEVEAVGSSADLYHRYQWHIKQVTGDGATFDIQPGNRSTVVAILDTGIDPRHPSIAPNYLYGKSFVPGESSMDGHSHGTHVAGTVAGTGRIRGVAPNAGLAAYKVLSNRGRGFTSWIAAGIVSAADDGVAVINMSLGGYRLLTSQSHVASAIVYLRAISYANRKNVVVVAAAGNNAFDLDNPNEVSRKFGIDQGAVIEVPGGLPNLITVSSNTSRDTLAYYSNYGGSVIELAGPGGDVGPEWPNPTRDRSKINWAHAVLSSIPNGRYGWKIGTSMAAPHVAGAAAAIMAEYPGIPAYQVRTLLQRSADDIGPVGHDDYFGHGRLNLYNALR